MLRRYRTGTAQLCLALLYLIFVRNAVIARIENMLETIVDGLLDEDNDAQLTITLRTRSSMTRRQRDVPGDIDASQARTQEICYPGSTGQDAWRFSEQSGDLDGAPANAA